ncbi:MULTISPECIES: glycosyltransferase [Providencia]|uniref:glycosyltransferase n=1 Tax=Providencia TaxID=586 RepID=UPI00234A57B4|nr:MULTISPECIES: glycosyltransferase [unclassified Providencia]
MKKQSFFFVHLFNDYSGSPLVLKNMINAIKKSGESITLLTSKHSGFLSNISETSYIRLFYKYSNIKLITFFFFTLSQIDVFLKLSVNILIHRFKKNKCTVVINTVLPFSAGLAAFLFANRTIYYIHETHIKPKLLNKLLLFGVRKFSDEIIYVSNYTKDAIDIQKNCIVIPNPLRNDFNLNPSLDFHAKHNDKNVFFSGSLKAYKGIYNFIKIAEHCPQINFIAALNCHETDFHEFVTKYHHQNISFFHRPNFIKSLYEKSFIILNLSIPEDWTETFGLSILEGMSYGCVPIVPPAGGPLEIVNPDFGYYIHSNHVDKISKIINDLSCNYNEWYKKSQSALNKSNEFSFQEYTKSINNFLGI